jgi:hypothetical protein
MRLLAALLLLIAGTTPSLAATGDWDFRVLLDGREIGRHRFSLQRAGEGVVLTSEAQFDVRVLFISAYRYVHEAVERWQDGCLQSLASRTETNGERISVSAQSQGGRLAVTGPAGSDLHDGCVMSFAYWDPRILEAERLLNSQTGELVPVQVTPQGRETVPVRGRPRPASRHRISGPGLSIDLWYADGRWVALEALAEGGRRLRYELQ